MKKERREREREERERERETETETKRGSGVSHHGHVDHGPLWKRRHHSGGSRNF